MTEYLVKGDVTLFLDGLNEVLTELRKPIRMEIQNLIEENPNLQCIITSRPLAYSNEFKKSPAFVLQRMENYQVEEFLQKNCTHKQTRTIIFKELEENPKLGKLIRIPLLLKMLINVVWVNKGVIPSNKVQIIKQFIQNLYERERRKLTTEIDFRVIHRLLCYLAYKTREKNGSNVGVLLEEYEAIMEDRIEKSKFTINVFEFFDTALDLNILVMDGNKFSFIHELYQEYFASEEIFKQLAKRK
jgi:predicted NACHT family NTPase